MDVMELARANTNNSTAVYCSLTAGTVEEKKHLYNVINNPTGRVEDMINKEINLKNVYVGVIEIADETTGIVENAPRCILIDDKGKSYACVSKGIYNALKNIFSVFGSPDTWEQPIKVNVKQISLGTNRTFTLEMV